MQQTTLRAQALWACVCQLYCLAVLPLTAAAAERPYMLYAADGRALHASGPLLWLGERGQAGSVGFRLQPVFAPDAEVHDGDAVWVRAEDGRYLTHWGRFPLLTRLRQLAVRWHVARAAGSGALGLAEAFALGTSDGRYELVLYTPNGALAEKSGATGEATAIAVIAHSAVVERTPTPD
jgi:hypothetical protein